ncbi:hypothetical protein AAXB25_33765 [Paenibacillus lautus]
MKTDKEKLISVIRNVASRDDEVDDAVIHLSKFNDDVVVDNLASKQILRS